MLVATEPYELPGGCEDARIVEHNGTYYMTYTGYDGVSARLCLATSRNLLSWTKYGPLFPDFVTRDVDKPWSKSGAILTKRLKGKYYMYFGDKDIYYATSPDLIHWTPGPVDDPVMRPQPGTYTEELLEPGPPPLITDNGYILLIHNAAAKDPDGKLIYRAGQALIDPAKPTEELARLTTPFLVPETPEETEGQVNNVVFVEGLVEWRGEWLLYYGQGDAGVGVLHGRALAARRAAASRAPPFLVLHALAERPRDREGDQRGDEGREDHEPDGDRGDVVRVGGGECEDQRHGRDATRPPRRLRPARAPRSAPPPRAAR